jgi:hypothetical protein
VLWLGLSGAAAAVVVAMLPGVLILVPRYVRQILPTVSVLGCLRLPALLALSNAALLIALGRLTPPLGVSGLSVLLALIAIGNAACVVALERRPLVGLVSELRRRACASRPTSRRVRANNPQRAGLPSTTTWPP